MKLFPKKNAVHESVAEVASYSCKVIWQADERFGFGEPHWYQQKRKRNNKRRPERMRPAAMGADEWQHCKESEKRSFAQMVCKNERKVDSDENEIENFLTFAFGVNVGKECKEQRNAEKNCGVKDELQKRQFSIAEQDGIEKCKRNKE